LKIVNVLILNTDIYCYTILIFTLCCFVVTTSQIIINKAGKRIYNILGNLVPGNAIYQKLILLYITIMKADDISLKLKKIIMNRKINSYCSNCTALLLLKNAMVKKSFTIHCVQLKLCCVFFCCFFTTYRYYSMFIFFNNKVERA
jgi:hypothetical protein